MNKNIASLTGVFTVFLLPLGIFGQTFVYVSLDGNDASGDSWATAFRTISNGVAHALGPTNVVLVSNGVYTLNTQILVDRAITVTSLHGRAETFINGGGVTRCLRLNHANAVVDGFTISNGLTASTSYDDSGGGVRISSGLLRNCAVTLNKANRYGGGICFDSTSVNAMALDCEIFDNQTTQTVTYSFGGGVYLQGNGSVVRGCTIYGNSAVKRGSGVLVTRGQDLLIDRCVISNNSTSGNTETGGLRFDGEWNLVSATASVCQIVNHTNVHGVVFNLTAPATVVDSTIARNYRGVHFTGATNFVSLVKNCMITGNSNADNVGAGVFLNQAGTAQNCQIMSNYASGNGAGVYMSRGGRLINCLVAYNKSPTSGNTYGGGVALHTMTQNNGSAVSACTIVSNEAQYGGGLCFITSTNTDFVVNTIIAGNTAGTDGADCYNHFSAQSSNAFHYSCVNIGWLAPGKHNITNSTPGFVGFTDGNFRLAPDSPCVNAGTNEAWMFIPGIVDLDGRPRIDRLNYRVDMGCYEYLSCGTMIVVR